METTKNQGSDKTKPQWLEGKVNYFSAIQESEEKDKKYQRANITLASGHQIMLNVSEKFFESNKSIQKGDYVKFPAYADENAQNNLLVESNDQKNIYGFNQAAGMEKTNPRSFSISTDLENKPVRVLVSAGADAVSTEFQEEMRTNVSAYVKPEDTSDRSVKNQLVTLRSGPKFHDGLKDVKKGDLIEAEGFVKINQKDGKTYTDIQLSKKPTIIYSKDKTQDKAANTEAAKQPEPAKPKKKSKKEMSM